MWCFIVAIRRLCFSETAKPSYRWRLQESDGVDATTSDQSPGVDEAVLFSFYLMLESLAKFISKNSLRNLRDIWRELETFRSHKGC